MQFYDVYTLDSVPQLRFDFLYFTENNKSEKFIRERPLIIKYSL